MYAKMINNQLVFAPNPIRVGGDYVGNPPDEVYTWQGYKPVTYTEPAGDAPEGYVWEPGWEETNSTIVRTWHLEELPDDISDEEVMSIILGGDGA